MDARLFDPKVQRDFARALACDNPISRLEAMRVLKKNGVDVEKAVAAAKAWKAGSELPVVKPPPSPLSLKSAPHLPAEKVKDLLLQLANGSLVDKVEAKRYCAANNIPLDEMRELARNIAGPAPSPAS